jgi:hypothetical protein
MYHVICDKHEYITATLTTSSGKEEKRFYQCRKCGILISGKDLTIEEKMDVFFADREVGKVVIKKSEELGYKFKNA